jgi:hypothetical protein
MIFAASAATALRLPETANNDDDACPDYRDWDCPLFMTIQGSSFSVALSTSSTASLQQPAKMPLRANELGFGQF